MSTATTFAEGDVIAGRYVVERLIGKGGMGAVYAARNQNSGRKVALKVIKAGAEETVEQRRRFLREAKAATAIQHPNVIEVLDVFEDSGGTLVMVMELLAGETLKEWRKRQGAVTLHQAAMIFLPITEALRSAHQKGIVHRDLKPENVFLAEKGGATVPTILDFGIAKVLDPTTINAETQGQETATGSLLGTPHYMSYEQAMSDKLIDQRADIWAVGVMLFELLTARRPIEFENLGEMYTAFITGTIPSIRDCVPELPADAGAVIDRCLAKERDGRLSDLSVLVEVLERYADPAVEGGDAGGRVVADLPKERASATLEGSSTAGLQATAAAPAPSRLGWAIGTVAVVGAIAGAAYFGRGALDASSGAAQPPAEAEPTASESIASEPVASGSVGSERPVETAASAARADGAAIPSAPEALDTASAAPAVRPKPVIAPRKTPPPPTPMPPAPEQPPPAPEPRQPKLANENPYGPD